MTTETLSTTAQERLRETRDRLCKEVKKSKEVAYIAGYLDGTLDMYNEAKKEISEP